MKKLSLFSRVMLLLVAMTSMSVTQVWGAKAQVELCTSWNKTFAYATAYSNDYVIDDLNDSTTKMTLEVQGVYRQGAANTYFQMNKKTGYFRNATKFPGKITKIETTWSATKGPVKCYFATSAAATSSDATVSVTAGTSVTYTAPTDKNYFYFNIDPSTGSGSAQMTSCIVYYETAGGGSDPELSLNPTAIDFGVVEQGGSVAAQSVTATLTNTTYAIATLSGTDAAAFEITAGEELTKTGTITVQPKAATLNTVGTYTASLDVVADGVEDTQSATITLVVKEPAAPTGNFIKFTGASLVEGDYVICSDKIAMGNTISSDRLSYNTITPSGDTLTNPEADNIWHIAPSATEGYWTIYNADVAKYAAGTGAKNKIQLLDANTDDKALWQISGSGSYEMVNKANATAGVNKNLRYNDTYGFACYSTSTGSALTLYAKLGAYALTKAAGITNGDIDAKVNETSVIGTDVAAGTTVTLSNTPDAGFTLDEYKVVKTDEETTEVAVTDGTFIMPAYPVTVSATFRAAKVLESIAIDPASTHDSIFWVGESFTTTGIIVKATFTGFAEPEDVTASCTFSRAEGVITDEVVDEEITVSFTEGTITKTASYTINADWMGLAELLENIEPTTTAVKVYVKLDKEPITKFFGTSGVGLNVTYGEPETTEGIEIYCYGVDETWVVGGTLSAELKNVDWKLYENKSTSATIKELCPSNWNDFTYTAPGPHTSIETLFSTSSEQTTKALYDNQVIILRNGVMYNLCGQVVK